MPRLDWIAAWVVLLSLALAGCAGHNGWRHACCDRYASCPDGGAETPCQVVERGKIVPDLTELATYDTTARGTPVEPTQYCELRPEQCQCLAAANSSLGNLLAAEGQLLGDSGGKHHGKSAAEASLKRDVLALRAIEERNRSAAIAMRLYYRLAEVEAGRDLLADTLAEAGQTIESFRQLKAAGLPVGTDEGQLQRQKVALLDQQSHLNLGIRQLNEQLRSLLGWEDQDGLPIWPAADLTVTTTPIDVEAAVAEGLRTRADLAQYRLLSENLDRDTLKTVRGGLQQVSGLLGSSPAARCVLLSKLCGAHKRKELSGRRSQLEQLNEDRQRAAAAEIRLAAAAVEARLQQIALAARKRDLWQQQLKRLQQRREADGVTPFDVSAARLEWLRAESELLQKVIAWKLAGVDLKEAQGLLAAECGYAVDEARGHCRR